AEQVGFVVPVLRQQHRRGLLRLALLGLPGRRDRPHAADPLLFFLVAAELAGVLAGPAVGWQGLVSPRPAGGGIDAADILDVVGLAAGALHFVRFAVVQVGHGDGSQNRLAAVRRTAGPERFCELLNVTLIATVRGSSGPGSARPGRTAGSCSK